MKILLSYTLAKEYQTLAKLPFLDDSSSDRMEEILVMAESNSLLAELLSQVDLDLNAELDCLCQHGFDFRLKLKSDGSPGFLGENESKTIASLFSSI